jgi:hypothetical protein
MGDLTADETWYERLDSLRPQKNARRVATRKASEHKSHLRKVQCSCAAHSIAGDSESVCFDVRITTTWYGTRKP